MTEGDEEFDRLVLGPSEGARSVRMIGWAVVAIAAGAAAYVCFAVLSKPLPAFGALGALVAVACVGGLVVTSRHLVWVDTSGISKRMLTTRFIPWAAVTAVRLERRQVKTPPMYDRWSGDRMDGEVILSHFALVAELRDGRILRLPIRAAEDTMTASRATELARALDHLRRASS